MMENNRNRWRSCTKIIGCTVGTKDRQRVRFQGITAGDLFRHGEVPRCKAVAGRHVDLLKVTRVPDKNQMEVAKIQLMDSART